MYKIDIYYAKCFINIWNWNIDRIYQSYGYLKFWNYIVNTSL